MTVDATTRNTVYEAARFLAGRCDWATTQDGRGYNGTDAGLGHWLAAQPQDTWTADMEVAAYEMLGKYRGQLADAGIDWDAVPVPADYERARRAARQRAQDTRVQRNRAARNPRVVELDGDELTVRAPYDATLVEDCRAIPTRRWDGKANRFANRPEVAAQVLALATKHDLEIADSAREALEAARDAAATLAALPERRIELLDEETYAVASPRDYALIDAIKRRTDGRRWNPDVQRWTIPATPENTTDLLAIASEHDLTVMPDAQPVIDRQVAAGRKEAAARAIREKASNAKDATLEMPEGFGFTLMPFQRGGVAYALDARRTFIADDMGTGKTIQALAAIEKAGAYPAVIVTPAAVKLKWGSEARKALGGLGRRVTVLSGRTAKIDHVLNADVIILNWDILTYWAGRKGKTRGRGKGPDKRGVLTRIGAKSVVYDESHYAKEQDAQRSRAAMMLSEAIYGEHRDDALLLNLTGSPILNRPVELAAQLQIIGRLDSFGGFFKFAKRYCNAYRDEYTGYWDFSGSSNLEELNRKLRASCFVRRLKKDVLTELPPKRFSRVPVELSNLAEYKRAERDVIAWLQSNVENDEEFAATLEGLSDHDRKLAVARRREQVSASARKAEELVRLNALRQTAAKGLIKPALEWIKDFIASSDEKLVVFAYHREVQRALLDGVREAGIGATSIFAGEHGQGNDKAFQNDPAIRVCVASLTAAREGIDLYASSNTLFVERNWSPKTEEQAEDRTHRIGQESDSATYWYLTPVDPEDNIYEMMDALLEAKRAVATAATDGEAQKRVLNESVVGQVADRLRAKAA